MTDPMRYEIPKGAHFIRCRSCGAAIYFVQLASGKKMPVTKDGTSHFIDCPGADRHRKRRTDA